MQNFDNINQTRLTSEIAVYDSGVGGISFLPTVRRLLPAERFVYYGDLANAPYGDRSQDFIIERGREIVAFFRKRGVKALVIACNTATSAAAATLRAENPDLPIFGMEPAIHLAVKRGEKRIIMLATELTAHGEKLRRLLTAEAGAAEIVTIACPGLMELIETNLIKGETAAIKEYLQTKLSPQLTEDCAVVLGCTHYIFLRGLLPQLFPGLRLYDGNLGTAQNLRQRLSQAGLLCSDEGQSTVEEIPCFGLPPEKFAAYLQLASSLKY